MVRKDGTWFWAAADLTALRDERGRPRGCVLVTRDRTEQRLAQELLEKRERRFRALIEHGWDAVCLLSAAGDVLYASPSTDRIHGYSRQDFVGRKALELVHPDDLPRLMEQFGRLLASPGQTLTCSFRFRHANGRWLWLEGVGTNLLDEPSVRAVAANFRDVTRQREADRRKDEWIALLAHELRNPLAPLLTGLHVLRGNGGDRSAVEQAGEMMERQVRRLARLVDDLLDVSRVTGEKIRLRRERLDLARLVRTTAADHQHALAEAGLTLSVETPETPVWLTGDATRLAQVLSNLLDNAAKFTDRGGRVAVKLTAAEGEPGARSGDRAPTWGSHAELRVRDTGVGIEPELLARLFEPFSQADRSLHRTKGGLGLGLALVKGLTELHGGAVQASSEGAGRGTEFIVRLPLEREPAALSEPVPGRVAPPSRERRRILVVEDNRDAADTLRMLLEMSGHEVRVAYTGPDGVRMAEEWRPAVVVSDIGLPGLDGFGVARALRANPATARVRLIAVTGYGSDDDRRLARESGFDHLLTKPADPGVLQQLLIGPA